MFPILLRAGIPSHAVDGRNGNVYVVWQAGTKHLPAVGIRLQRQQRLLQRPVRHISRSGRVAAPARRENVQLIKKRKETRISDFAFQSARTPLA
jgi:hypothetical protein